MEFQFIVLKEWSARASCLESKDAFRQWLNHPHPLETDEMYKPDCRNVPARLRGKSSKLSRFIMEPFFEIIDSHQLDAASIDVVFASRFGEIQVLESLFECIAEKQSLSPLDFCNSVHHTATSYLNIATKNQQISRTVSANEHSFVAALTEVFCLLNTGSCKSVMLLLGDQTVPHIFGRHKMPPFAFGAALLFDKEMARDGVVIELAHLTNNWQSPVSFFDWLRCTAINNSFDDLTSQEGEH